MDQGNKPPEFEFGLVMAGAISAGAYTAGVIDFLLEALDAWEAAKADPAAEVPRHGLRLRVLSGASAGAMTSAITTVSLGSVVDPVHDVANPPPPERNRLFDAWVNQIDISRLLTTTDIDKSKKAISLLDSTALGTIANDALVTERRGQPRSYVDDPLAVFLTVANLRGVPYDFQLFGSSSNAGYGMYEHMDHMAFAVSTTGKVSPGSLALNPADAPQGGWPVLATAALASGAFPGGLAPRLLERDWNDYGARHNRAPLWRPPAGSSYRFLCVDGGLMNNEPFELARRYLAGQDLHNPREGPYARRAVILIDPFPNRADFREPIEPDDRLVSVISQMFGALISQARFKPEELNLAADENVYSRFAISPSRKRRDGSPADPAIASGILGGFGGFLHRSFREHDFQLGRRNCQAFLRWHFCLPVSNPLFAGVDSGIVQDFCVRDRKGEIHLFKDSKFPTEPFLPIIPLVGSAEPSAPTPPPPSGAVVNQAQLRKSIKRRVGKFGAALADNDLRSLLGGIVPWIVARAWDWYLAGKVTDKAMDKIRGELARLNER